MRRRGSTTIEFTLVGIPLMFALISIFEMARGMWMYHTMAYALKEGTRYVIVHGQNCDPSGGYSNCQINVGQIAQRIQDAGVGLDPNELTVTLTSASNGAVTCAPLATCLPRTDTWPQYPDNQTGLPVSISGRIPFRSAIAMFWPGTGKGMNFAVTEFPAASQESIQF